MEAQRTHFLRTLWSSLTGPRDPGLQDHEEPPHVPLPLHFPKPAPGGAPPSTRPPDLPPSGS